MPHVRGYWIYTMVIISFIMVFIPCTIYARCFEFEVHEEQIRFHKIIYLIYFLSQLVSCVLETVAYASLSSHYDTDLNKPLRDAVSSFTGCGGPNFTLALEEVETPVIYVRPMGQTISLIFGWLLLIDLIIYFQAYLQAYR